MPLYSSAWGNTHLAGLYVLRDYRLHQVLVVETESYHVISLGTARFLMAFSCLLIFTQNARFSQTLQTLGSVSGASWPLVLSLSAVCLTATGSALCITLLRQITCLYARAAYDVFGHTVIDDYGSDSFFGTYGTLILC